MQGSARKDVVCGAARGYTFTVPGPKWKSWVKSAWDELLRDVIPEAVPDAALTVEQIPVKEGPVADFADHFFFETSTHYIRQETTFSGQPTVTGVINVERGEVANPDGIPFPPAFQPNSDHVYSFMNWGTRGWLSPHVNTNFSLRYRQDLTSVLEGSPSLGVINTFRPGRLFELLSGFVEIGQLGSTGALARSSLQVGRQFVYGAELAALDGASFSTHQRHYSLTLFGGRRFSYFSNPDQRAIGGSNIAFRLPGDAGLEYRGLFYVKGTHNVIFRKRFEPNWVFRTDFKMVGGSPVDFGAQVMYLPTDGKSTVRLSFFQKLSDKDFFYDYTLIARDRDPFNRLSRLNLGPLSPYSQVAVHARREILPRLRVGGSVWMRRLNDPEEDRGAFLASFEDYRFNVQTYPLARLETFLEFHQRNTDRPSPFGTTEFDDGRVEDGRGCSGRLRRVGPVSRPRSSNRTCGFPASGSPTGFLPQAVAGGGPRCIRRRRSTPNWPNTTRSLNRRVPRDDTFLRLRKNPRTRSHTWLSTARYAISRVP